MKVLLKKVGCQLEVVETEEKYFGACVHSFLGKNINVERIYLDGFEFIMAVDEDGLVKNLPLNFYMAFNNPYCPVQRIVGDVLFVRNKSIDPSGDEIWDFEVSDVTEQDIEDVNGLFSPFRQKFLRGMYCDE